MSELLSVSSNDLAFVRLAARAAATSPANRFRLGAVLVRGGSVLASGVNRHRNDPVMYPGLPRATWSVHAEQACLRRAGDPDGGTLFVVRINKRGQWRMARPCVHCWERAFEAGITQVVYTTNTGVVREKVAANIPTLSDAPSLQVVAV